MNDADDYGMKNAGQEARATMPLFDPPESDPFEAFVVSEPGAALGEGGDGFIVFGIGLEGDVVESEDGVFDGDGALQLPAAVGDGLDKAGFESAGLETFRPSPRFRRVSEMAVLRRSPFKMH